MKLLFIVLTLICIATSTLGQDINYSLPDIKLDKYKTPVAESNAIPVFYSHHDRNNSHAAIFLNGDFIGGKLTDCLNPKSLKRVYISKGDTLIDHTMYSGKIYIESNDNYSFQIISLTELKNKYTNLAGIPVVFMLGEEFIYGNYDKCFIDANNLSRIFVNKLQAGREGLNIGIIKMELKVKNE